MKKFTLLFVLLLPFFGFSQALSGNYVINSSNPAPFNNIYNAVNHLNTAGINNSVTFLLDDNYTLPENITSPITITTLINHGSNSNATLTIKPNTNRSLITLTASAPQNNGQTRHFFKIDRADNIIIDGSNNGTSSKNLVIKSAHQSNYNDQNISSSLIWLGSSSSDATNNITLKNISFEGYSSDQISSTSVGIIFSENGTITNNEGKGGLNNIITNNNFTKLKTAIQVLGKTSSPNDGLLITNNSFGSSDSNSVLTRRAIRLSNLKNFTISNNNINGIYVNVGNTEDFSGIFIEGNSSNGTIASNVIANITKATGGNTNGINLSSSNSSSNIEVRNNMISKISSPGNDDTNSGPKGIFINSGGGYKIFNNTIHMNSTIVTGSNCVSTALFVNGGTNLNIQNNIFVMSQNTGRRYAVYASVTASAFASLNYNNYYSTGSIAYLGSNKNFAEWKTATGKDTNSLSILPIFTSATDLHLTVENTTLDNKGLPLPSVITDIDDEVRSTSTPDMGADEFTAARCGSSTTWNGTDWSNGNPNNTKKAIIAGNYSSISFIACELQINSNVTVNVAADKYIQVVNGIVNNGTLVLENTASLIQIENDATYTGNPITVKKITAPMKRYDFTYWSSPVIGYTLQALSPDTLGDKYYSYNPTTGWTIHYNGTATMTAGTGYIVRAPQSYSITDSQVFSTQFVGLPNTGNITQPIVANASNLIGNPYPSAISADAIFSANSGVIDGTFYFWTHNSLPSTANSGNATYNYSSDDYASYNGVGGVKTKSAVTGGQTPTGNIASGQSFFIAGKTNGNVTFSNSMRVKAGNNSQFFRTSNSTQSEEEPTAIEKNRLWLNISNEAGDFNETLIGYVSNATNGLDKAFDGVNLSSGTTTLYSIIDTNNLVIQGRALPFTNTDVVPLGMKISTAGQYTINMDQFDGLFTSQNIYLFDSLTNTTHDLKASDYVFNSEIGTFNSRFEIRYVNGTELGIDTPIVSNNDVIVYKTGNQIAVKATNFTIDNVQVYDLTGKVIFSKAKVNSNEFATSGLNVGTQVVIVKVNLDNNQSVSKKVIMN